ncbi:MAG: RecX family transcriptional regulator [Armatimonadetes bacterium]|nr:RecX family transcriptional regulator [Armatimonadota bacterium]
MSPDAYSAAIDLLGKRAMFSGALIGRLEGMNFAPADIAQALERLKARGLLSDEALAASLAEREQSKKHASRQRISEKLESMGAPSEVIETVLAALPEDSVTAEAALASKRLVSTAAAGRYLARLGFEDTVIESALEGAFQH